MRLLAPVLLLAACSRIAGIGDEFAVADRDAAELDDGTMLDAYVPTQRTYLKASNPDASDFFGYGIAVSADTTTIAVSAVYEDSDANTIGGSQTDNTAADAGAVYVFRRTGGGWAYEAYIKASNSDAGDRFGYSIALSADGNTLAVGAPFEDSSGIGVGGVNDNNADNAGAAYVFVRSGTTWSQERYIKATNTDIGDNFGYWVDLSADGDTLAISAPGEDSAALNVGGSQTSDTAMDSGAIYVFARAADWAPQAYLKPSSVHAGRFGQAFTISGDGNTLAGGAPTEASSATGIDGNGNNTGAPDSGAAYVFSRSGTAWSPQAYIKASNTATGDAFGWTLGISDDGTVLAIGAPNEDSAATGLGANQADDSKSNAGAAYVFARSGTTWMQESYVKPAYPDVGDQFGTRLAISRDGNELIVGSIHEDSGATGVDGNDLDETANSSGAAYLFVRSTSWLQSHFLKASNTDAGDEFGFLASHCTRVVGADNEDSASAGVGGDQSNDVATDSGAVYVFE